MVKKASKTKRSSKTKTKPSRNSTKSASKTKPKRSLQQKSLVVNTVSHVTVTQPKIPTDGAGQGLSMGPGAAAQPAMFMLSEQSQQVPCPQCNNVVQTQTNPTPGMCTYALCLVTLPICCCFIPFLLDSTKDIEHRCPVCGYSFGKYSRLNL